MRRALKEKVRTYLSKIKINSKNAFFVVIAAIGFTMLIAGIGDALRTYSAFSKIVAGTVILLFAGYLGYGILGEKRRR